MTSFSRSTKRRLYWGEHLSPFLVINSFISAKNCIPSPLVRGRVQLLPKAVTTSWEMASLAKRKGKKKKKKKKKQAKATKKEHETKRNKQRKGSGLTETASCYTCGIPLTRACAKNVPPIKPSSNDSWRNKSCLVSLPDFIA